MIVLGRPMPATYNEGKRKRTEKEGTWIQNGNYWAVYNFARKHNWSSVLEMICEKKPGTSAISGISSFFRVRGEGRQFILTPPPCPLTLTGRFALIPWTLHGAPSRWQQPDLLLLAHFKSKIRECRAELLMSGRTCTVNVGAKAASPSMWKAEVLGELTAAWPVALSLARVRVSKQILERCINWVCVLP